MGSNAKTVSTRDNLKVCVIVIYLLIHEIGQFDILFIIAILTKFRFRTGYRNLRTDVLTHTKSLGGWRLFSPCGDPNTMCAMPKKF